MSFSLYRLHDELIQLFERLETATPEEQDKIVAELQDAQMAWDDKLANCCGWLKNLEAEAEMFDAEIERLKAKRDSLRAQHETFKGYLAKFAPKTKWSSGVHSISWRESKSVEIDDETLIPAAFKREIWKLEPDKKEIKAAIESGAAVPGARLVTKNNIQVK